MSAKRHREVNGMKLPKRVKSDTNAICSIVQIYYRVAMILEAQFRLCVDVCKVVYVL